MNKLLLVDGNNVMFRAYYATAAMGNLMVNKNGIPTNMVYGFINIINKVINEGYTHIAIAFDKGSKTKRHLMYKDYKAGRAETPKELIEQIPYIHKYLECMNIHYYLDEEYEADDIIASIKKMYGDSFDEVAVLSNDNDLFQLISSNSYSIYTKLKEQIKYDSSYLMEEKGIEPSQIPDYKGLIGDKSDNLLGVEGIGPVSAQKLLNEYKSLENIYSNIDLIKGKLQERLIKDKDQAFFTKEMATLNPTFNINESIDDLKIVDPSYDKLKEFYVELDFNSFLRKLPISSIKEEFKYSVLDSSSNIDSIIDNDGLNFLVLDNLEENYHIKSSIGFGLTTSKGSFYIDYNDALSNFSFQMFLCDESIKKCVYDYKKIYVTLLYDSIKFDGVVDDLMLSSYLVNPDLTKDDLSLISTHFGYSDLTSDINVYGKGVKHGLPEKEVYQEYIARKSYALSVVNENVLNEIKNNDQEYLYKEIELPFSKVLGDMEYNGLRVDLDELDKYECDLLKEIKDIEQNIYSLCGHEFNILSPKQLGTVLFDELNLPSSKKTKTGYSTDSSVLEEIRVYHPIVDLILRYRMLSKLEGTYVSGVREATNLRSDSHIHTIYRQTLTDTGRLSSTEPNLQNLPIRNKEASEFRKVFIGENDSYLMSSDYSQIELRVLAHMSGDEALIECFNNGDDIHEATAKAIYKKEEVTKEERSSAKAVNFGIIYGISAWGLSNDIGISPKEAERFIEKYHESFKEILPFTNSLVDDAKELGYVKTMFNRRRYIRDINSPIYSLREFSKRTAMNAPIQGSAADILKIAMVNLDKELKKNSLHSKMVLTIHDEVVLNVNIKEIEKTIEVVERVLTSAVKLKVPLLVETNYGLNLYEAK